MMQPIVTHHGDPRLRDEFWAKTHVNPTTGCWVWVSDKVSKTGTPMHGAKVAWRFAYDRLVEPLMRGSTGKRACDEVLCVNPAHRVVQQPKLCPACQQMLPAPTSRIEPFITQDGLVGVGRIVVDESGEEVPPSAERMPVYRDGPRTVDREGRRVESALPRLPAREGARKQTRAEALEGLRIQSNPLPLGDPTGRWQPAQTPSGLGSRKVEFSGGRLRLWEELTPEQKSAFSRMRGKQKLEPGTFEREIEEAMGEFD